MAPLNYESIIEKCKTAVIGGTVKLTEVERDSVPYYMAEGPDSLAFVRLPLDLGLGSTVPVTSYVYPNIPGAPERLKLKTTVKVKKNNVDITMQVKDSDMSTLSTVRQYLGDIGYFITHGQKRRRIVEMDEKYKSKLKNKINEEPEHEVIRVG